MGWWWGRWRTGRGGRRQGARRRLGRFRIRILAIRSGCLRVLVFVFRLFLLFFQFFLLRLFPFLLDLRDFFRAQAQLPRPSHTVPTIPDGSCKPRVRQMTGACVDEIDSVYRAQHRRRRSEADPASLCSSCGLKSSLKLNGAQLVCDIPACSTSS